MTEKNEALRLADLLCKDGHECCDFQAAAELRRLSIENEAQRDALLEALKALLSLHDDPCPHDAWGNTMLTEALLKAETQRDALLEALKTVEWHGQGSCWVVDADKIAAAIKAVEEEA